MIFSLLSINVQSIAFFHFRTLMFVPITFEIIACLDLRKISISAKNPYDSSRFLDEIPTSSCKFAQAQQWQQYEVNNFFTQWVGLRSVNPEVFTFAAPKSVQKQALQSKQATPKTNNVNVKFRKHQTIKHKTFGVGIVKDVEQKKSKVFVTAHFKAGTKKVEASFLDTV